MVYENWLACFSVFKRKDATDREFFGNLLFVKPSIYFALNSLILLSITLSLFSKNVSALTHNGSRCITPCTPRLVFDFQPSVLAHIKETLTCLAYPSATFSFL